MPSNLKDVTPDPNPDPKKAFQFREADGGPVLIPWMTGQTLQQALVAGVPAAVRTHVNAFDANIYIALDIREV